LFFFGFFYVVRSVFFLKTLDSPCRVHEFLFARIEWMANRANLSVDFLSRATRLKGITTPAANDYLLIFRMNPLFHKYLSKFLNLHITFFA